MAKIVMFWDCPYCRNKKIPGYLRECKKGCGAPRPRTVNFYHSKPVTYATPAQTKLFGKADSKITPFTNLYDLATFLTFYIGQPHEVDVNYFGGVLELR